MLKKYFNSSRFNYASEKFNKATQYKSATPVKLINDKCRGNKIKKASAFKLTLSFIFFSELQQHRNRVL